MLPPLQSFNTGNGLRTGRLKDVSDTARVGDA